MTDYAKHIETGSRWLLSRGDAIRAEMGDFVAAAIELMRAAAPKSPEEEREHCVRAVRAFLGEQNEEFVHVIFDDGAGLGDLYLKGRAAARAEGYNKGFSDATKAHEAECPYPAAQAESAERLRVALACGKELCAAQAEIARLGAELAAK